MKVVIIHRIDRSLPLINGVKQMVCKISSEAVIIHNFSHVNFHFRYMSFIYAFHICGYI